MANLGNSTIVGLDDGHDHIKVYLGKDPITGMHRQYKMQSRAAVGKANMGDDDSVNEELVVVGDTLFTVSEALSEFTNTRYDEYPTSELSKALVYQALRNALNSHNISSRNLAITSGLPVNRFYNTHSRTKNVALLEAKKLNLLEMDTVYNVLDENHEKPRLKIKDHKVLCEANAAYYDVLFGDDDDDISDIAQESGIYEGGAAVLDIGGRTTDCVVVNPQGRNLNANRSGTLDTGVISFQDSVRGQLKSIHKLGFVSELSLKNALLTGVYKVGSKEIDISEILSDEKSKLYKKIELFMESTIGDGSDLPAIILVGGGAYILNDFIAEKYQAVIIPDDAEFANARGFYKLLKFVLN